MTELTLHGRIDTALFYVDTWDAGEAAYIVNDILSATFRALKRPRFAALSHDEFDELTASVRKRAGQELGERIGGLVDISEVKWAIDHELDATDKTSTP